MSHHSSDIDGAAMQIYLRKGQLERSKATWELLSAVSRGISGIWRRVSGAGTLHDGAACTR